MIKTWIMNFDGTRIYFDTDTNYYKLHFTCNAQVVEIGISVKTAKTLLNELPFEVLV